MKKLGGLTVLLMMALMPVGGASAAACANSSAFGAVELSVPSLPDIRSRVLWVRMQTPEPEGMVLAEINQQQCLEIGGSALPAGRWTWQSSPSGPIEFPFFSGNKIKLIGVSDGVKVDRILLTEPDCTPKDFGNNCQDSVELKADGGPPATIITPPSKDPVSGDVVLSSTPEQNQSRLESLDYVVDYRIVQSSSTVKPFDTTLLTNGKHTVQIHTYLTNGSVIRESTVVDVRNPESFYTPALRWIKLNFGLAKLLALIIGGLIILAALYNLLRTWHINRRQRKFRGF